MTFDKEYSFVIAVKLQTMDGLRHSSLSLEDFHKRKNSQGA